MQHDNTLPTTDHAEAHEQGECHDGCPWCMEEQIDLGGEG